MGRKSVTACIKVRNGCCKSEIVSLLELHNLIPCEHIQGDNITIIGQEICQTNQIQAASMKYNIPKTNDKNLTMIKDPSIYKMLWLMVSQ